MVGDTPTIELDPRYGEPGAHAIPWTDARDRLARAGVAWLSTVRPDGRPHVTPLITVWVEGAAWFCTGVNERKAHNLAANPHVVLTAGTDDLHEGVDVVIEGAARRETDDAVLGRVAAAYESKYGSEWHFDARDGELHQGDVEDGAIAFAVAPVTAFAFGKAPYSQTRYRFPPD